MQRCTSPIFELFASPGALLVLFGFFLLDGRDVLASGPPGSADSIQSLRAACTAALAREARGDGPASSREPCHRALRLGGTPEDERNEVASLMSPVATPSLDDLTVSALLVDAAERQAVDQPWAYLARCDIARRMGSADTLAVCLADLRRVAPHHRETLRALAQTAGTASGGIWLLRALLLVGLFGTALHAAYRARRTGRRGSRIAASTVASALFVACLFQAPFGASA